MLWKYVCYVIERSFVQFLEDAFRTEAVIRKDRPLLMLLDMQSGGAKKIIANLGGGGGWIL